MDITLNKTTNDIEITNNEFILNSSVDYVEQKLKTNLQTFLGECFTDTDVGTPYFQEILGKNIDLSQVEAAIKDVILTTPGVINLTFFELDYDNNLRKLSVSFAVESEEGGINIEGFELI